MRKIILIFFLTAVFALGALSQDINLGDFENQSISPWYEWTPGTVSVVANPSTTGNTSSFAAQLDQTGGAWKGIARWDNTPVLSDGYIQIALDVYFTNTGGTLKLQLDNPVSSGAANYEAYKNDIPADTWTHVEFDITGLAAYDYRQIAFQTSVADLMLFDNITLVEKPPVDPVDTVILTGADYIWLGGKTTLDASAEPISAPQTFTWEVDDESVATIDTNGVLTSVSIGTVTVTATTTDTSTAGAGKFATKDVEVQLVPDSVVDMVFEDFESGLNGWQTWGTGIVEIIENPDPDAVNGSDSVLRLTQTSWEGAQKYNDSLKFRNWFVTVQCDVYLTAAATFQVQIDQGSPDPDITKSVNITTINEWVTVSFDVNGAADTSYKQIWFRLNQATGVLLLDNIVYKVTPRPAEGIEIVGDDSINVDNGTLQLDVAFTPPNAINKNVTWSLLEDDYPDTAEISTNGLLQAYRNGTVLVKAVSEDGGFADTFQVIITNQVVVEIDSVIINGISGVKTITMDDDTLQIVAEVYPLDADNRRVIWSVDNTDIAIISANGILTPIANGTVKVIGTAHADVTKADTIEITISNQWANFALDKVVVGLVDNAADFTGELSMLWDADSIYLAFDITDDSIVSTGTNYQVDNIEIYLDIDNSKNIHWPRNQGWISNDPTFDTNDYQLRLVPDTAFAKNNSLKGVRQVYTKTTTGYKFELNIAWDSLLVGFVPGAGKLIGFDLLVSDNDAVASDANRNQITMNSPTDKPFNDPSLWATLQLDAGNVFSIVPDEEAPTIPANVAATATKADVEVTWDASSDDIAVLRYIILENGTAIDTIFAVESDNSYTIKKAPGDFSYSVIAVDNSGNLSDTSAAANVSVTHISVTGISVTGGSIDTKGGTLQMTVTVTPSNATDPSVTWTISDESIATIDAAGLVTAVSNGTVTVTATSVDVPSVSETANVVISGQVGIDNPVTCKFTAYPNPVNDILYIKGSASIEYVEVYNIVGNLILTIENNNAIMSIDVSGLESGVYIARAYTSDNIGIIRFTKQ